VQISCSILREGKINELPLEQVVPGDIIILNAGDVIPGDSLLLESKELYVDEAAFTGETFPVEKIQVLFLRMHHWPKGAIRCLWVHIL